LTVKDKNTQVSFMYPVAHIFLLEKVLTVTLFNITNTNISSISTRMIYVFGLHIKDFNPFGLHRFNINTLINLMLCMFV